RNHAGFPECSIPRPATFREAACAQPAAPGSPAIQSIWRAPAGTIPSAAAGQAHTHPCGPSSPSSPTMPPSHAASPAERFEILLPHAPHATIVKTPPPQAQSDSPNAKFLEETTKNFRLARDPRLLHDLASPIHNANAREFQRDVDSGVVLHGCPPSQMPGA